MTASVYVTMLLVPAVMVGMYFFMAQFMQEVTPAAFADAVSDAFFAGVLLAGLALLLILLAVRPEQTTRALDDAPARGTMPSG